MAQMCEFGGVLSGHLIQPVCVLGRLSHSFSLSALLALCFASSAFTSSSRNCQSNLQVSPSNFTVGISKSPPPCVELCANVASAQLRYLRIATASRVIVLPPKSIVFILAALLMCTAVLSCYAVLMCLNNLKVLGRDVLPENEERE